MKSIKLPFGINEHNILVHIADVERGKKCNCICPGCRSPLIAAQGNKKQSHFKHAINNECESGLESAVHLAAKKIIMERKELRLPDYVCIASRIDSRGIKHSEEKNVVENGTVVKFDSVEEEVKLPGMKVDILATKRNNPLIIEIFYRHKVEDEKLFKIAEAKMSAIEINLSGLMPENVINWEAFWLYVNDPVRIQWLYNAKAQDIIDQELNRRLEIKVEKQEEKYKQEEKELLKVLQEIKVLSSKEEITKLKQNAEMDFSRRKLSSVLPYTLHSLPYFLNKKIENGDWIYGCDRRIWQAAFYWGFVYKKKEEFSIRCADNWLRKTMECKVPWSVGKLAILRKGYSDFILNDTNQPGSFQVLRGYCYYLCKVGLLEYIDGDRGYPGSYYFCSKEK